MSRYDIIGIPLTKISRNPNNRKVHPKDPAVLELAASIAAMGVLQPVGVRVTGKDAYTLIWGERRLVACKAAKQDTIPAIVVDDAENADYDAMAAVENLQREDLSPAEEMDQLEQLQKVMTVDEIVASTGKTKSWFYRRMGLKKLTADWQKVASEVPAIPALRLEEIARLPEEAQNEAFEHWQEWDFSHLITCPLQEFRNTIMEFMDGKLPALWPMDNEHLYPQAGSCDECVKRTGAQPDLFDEATFSVKDGEKCLDMTCYRIKQQLWSGMLYAEAVKKAKKPLLVIFKDTDEKARFLNVNAEFKDAQGTIDQKVRHATAKEEDAFQAFEMATGKVRWFATWDAGVQKMPVVQATIKNPSKPKVAEEAKKQAATGEPVETTASGAPKMTVRQKIIQKLNGFWKAVVEEFYAEVDANFDPVEHLPGWKNPGGPTGWMAAFGMTFKQEYCGNFEPWKNVFRAGTKGADGLMTYQSLHLDAATPKRILQVPNPGEKEINECGRSTYVGKPSDILAHEIRCIILDRIKVPSGLSSKDIDSFLPELFMLCDLMDLSIQDLFAKQAEGFNPPQSWKSEAGSIENIEKIWTEELERMVAAAMSIVVEAKNPPTKEDKPKTKRKPRAKKDKAPAAA